jgi:DNA-binding CsgD family transcriptional regulator
VQQGEPLSDREVQVLHGVARGLSNAEIGAELFLAEDTVKCHLRRVGVKLGTTGRAHAVVRALQVGYLTLRAPRRDSGSSGVEIGPQAAVQRVTRLLAGWQQAPPPPPHLAGHHWQQCITQLAHALNDQERAA